MDDTNQISNIKSQLSNNTNQDDQITGQTQQQTPTQQQGPLKQEEWVLPTSGSTKKESEPLPSAAGQTEWIKPSEAPVEVSKEVAEVGVEAVSEMPKVDEAAKQVGIEAAKEATPVPSSPTSPHTQTPLTKVEAKKEVEGNPIFKDVTSARYWLAMLLTKYFSEEEKKKGK